MKLMILLSLAFLCAALSATAFGQENLSVGQENQSLADLAPMEELNSSELMGLLLEAQKDLETYRFTMDIFQEVSLLNLSDSNQTEPFQLQSRSLGAGAINLTDRAMRMAQAALVVPEGQEENAIPTSTVLYFINDTMYLVVDGNRTQMDILLPEAVWESQNQMEQQVDLLNDSDIQFLGIETIDGTQCYKIEVVPNMETYSAMVSEQIGGVLPVGSDNLTSLDLAELFNNSTLQWTYWIDVDTNFVKRVDAVIYFTMTPDVFGTLGEEMGEITMDIRTESITTFSDYNEPLTITPPEMTEEAAADTLNNTAEQPSVPLEPLEETEPLGETEEPLEQEQPEEP